MQADRKMDISMFFSPQKTYLLVIGKIDPNGSLFLKTFEFFFICIHSCICIYFNFRHVAIQSRKDIGA